MIINFEWDGKKPLYLVSGEDIEFDGSKIGKIRIVACGACEIHAVDKEEKG